MKKISIKLLMAAALAFTFISCASGSSDDSSNNNNSTVIADSTIDWLNESVPSFCETYKDLIPYTGFAVEYGISGYSQNELSYTDVQKGLKKHANTITMGNEFKPQFIMQWWGSKPEIKGTFTATNGTEIQTPVLKGFNNVDAILTICKNNGLKMRGHTLAWHSQTEDSFFYENYDPSSKKLVSATVMEARLEWYIKTVLEHVAEWEQKNNGGEHIIWAWDVFNEVTPDGSSDLLRTSSKWYQVYKNSDFVVQAFQYANKYAPADVKLCYNDYGGIYGTNLQAKHTSQMKIVDLILAHKDDAALPTRIDAMGLQSHYSVKVSAGAVESEIKDFINKGLDVHITELDIGTWNNYNNSKDSVGVDGKQFNSLAAAYKAYFQVYIKNRKTDSAHGVENVTVWGLNDENTWLNVESNGQMQYLGNCKQYPLLFTKPGSGWKYYPKPAFNAVIAAATEFSAE